MSMPSGKQPKPGPLARAVSAEVRALQGRRRITALRLAEVAGLSPGYLGKRLRDQVPFTLNDVEVICSALDEDLQIFMREAFRIMGRSHDPDN